MKFSKTSQALFDFIALAVKDFHCEGKKMFGGIAYFVNGNMFTGAHQSDMFLRLSVADQKLIKNEHDEVSQFEPLPGRKMAEYVAIPESVFSDPVVIRKWLEKSYEYLLSLPPKEKKSSSKKNSATIAKKSK